MSSRDEKQHGFHTLTSTQTQFQPIFELSVMRSAASVMYDVHVIMYVTCKNVSHVGSLICYDAFFIVLLKILQFLINHFF